MQFCGSRCGGWRSLDLKKANDYQFVGKHDMNRARWCTFIVWQHICAREYFTTWIREFIMTAATNRQHSVQPGSIHLLITLYNMLAQYNNIGSVSRGGGGAEWSFNKCSSLVCNFIFRTARLLLSVRDNYWFSLIRWIHKQHCRLCSIAESLQRFRTIFSCAFQS